MWNNENTSNKHKNDNGTSNEIHCISNKQEITGSRKMFFVNNNIIVLLGKYIYMNNNNDEWPNKSTVNILQIQIG